MPEKRSQSAFYFINTFKHPTITVLRWAPLYKPRLAQYCRSFHRLCDKHLCGSVEIFVYPTFIVNTLYLELQATVLHMGYIKRKRNTEFLCDNSRHQSIFKKTLSFCNKQDFWLPTPRHQNYKLHVYYSWCRVLLRYFHVCQYGYIYPQIWLDESYEESAVFVCSVTCCMDECQLQVGHLMISMF
jgi:hypothetical protein